MSLLLVLAVSLSCKLVDRFRSGGVVSGDYSKVAGNLPNYDPKDPAPSPGALALRQLAELEPSVEKLVGDVEAAERAALKTGLAQLRAQRGAGSDNEQLFGASRVKGTNGSTLLKTKSPMVGAAFPALFIYQGRVDSAIGGAHTTALVGALISGLSDMFVPLVPVGANISKSATEKEGGATTSMSVEIGRADDGSTKLGLGFKTEVTKDGVSAAAELASKIDGQRCPNAEGQLPFTIKVRLGAESGGAVYTRDVTAMVRALVNDDAKVEGYTMDLTQATRQVKERGLGVRRNRYNDDARRRQLQRVELPGDPSFPTSHQSQCRTIVHSRTRSGVRNRIDCAQNGGEHVAQRWLHKDRSAFARGGRAELDYLDSGDRSSSLRRIRSPIKT